MKIIFSRRASIVLKNKAELEKKLDVKIKVTGKGIQITGEPYNEYVAEKVIDAISLGFTYETAILIKEQDLILRVLHIKDITTRKDLSVVRGRIIGKEGRTLRTLSQLSDSFIETNDNEVGIIGHPENIETAETALKSLIKGSKASNVYTYLEKHHPEPIIDLGLKIPKKKKRSIMIKKEK